MQPTKTCAIDESLEVCSECGYKGGFHVLIERRQGVVDANIRLHLKCPGCGAAFDIGWVGRLTD